MSNALPEEYYQILEDLQAADFVLVELTLYLDTHPTDQNAIAQFNSYVQHRNQIKYEFESRFGPLQQFGNSFSDEKWSWHSSPWPWQV
ncbi:spore coat protein CotJB [Bacillus massiliigorillae]|uniref:spore coat protein CotJB n=1 Tax=Bacillus massiliigorillae TaxID=1243664 RepID=UPI0003A3C45B|nr:spore coat protein CotJB [Bacillus massiliigorillae]